VTELPQFRYHPEPLATGEIEPSEDECLNCGQRRGYLYVGPVFAEKEIVDELCPWCIADGSAAARFDACRFCGRFFFLILGGFLADVAETLPELARSCR
jgi:uncharacterized protein CbrC (UPF0167 family)